MPDVQASIEYLQRVPLYDTEKPYWCQLPPQAGFDPDKQRMDNLEWETHPNIPVEDIRGSKEDFKLDTAGFQVLDHKSQFSEFDSALDVTGYKLETEKLLTEKLDAVYVKCYDFIQRKNIQFVRKVLDLNDPLHTEGPARGAHNDITKDSWPLVVSRYMPAADQKLFLKPGVRLRIINTWRTLIPVLEDRPLALCDSNTVELNDLVATDRVIPDRDGEVYYLTYNPSHKWFWLEHQTPREPFVFVMYDTKAGPHRRFCPHVSFDNPRASDGAAPRRSVETRSIVITRD